MKRNFCTLFDSNYLFKGLSLYRSLEKHCPDFILYILCMDDRSFEVLSNMKLQNANLVRLSEFEDPELLAIKPTRTSVEYCWTITPSWPLYLLKKHPEMDMISYVDADCFFFSSPESLFMELGNRSVLIIGHNYSPQYSHLEKMSGKFNVGVLSFRQNKEAYEVLEWWRARCNEWCFYYYEDGKMGDQLYLDKWPETFPQVHVLQHRGGCVAPWNIHQYKLTLKNGVPQIDGQPIIFYHFHALKILCDLTFVAAVNYNFSNDVHDWIYEPYVNTIRKERLAVKKLYPEFEAGIESYEQSDRYKRGCPRKLTFWQKVARKSFKEIRHQVGRVWTKLERWTAKSGTQPCPLCKQAMGAQIQAVSDDRFGFPGQFPIYLCKACGHRFLKAQFNDQELTRLYSDYYPRSQIDINQVKAVPGIAGADDWWAGNERAVHNVPHAVRVLDVGCGFGESLLYHIQRDCEAYGSETDENAKKSVEKLSLPIKVGPFKPEQFPQEFFDYITMDQVIEHVADPKEMLQKISGLLKPGGKFVFSTPNGSSVGSALFGRKWIHWHAPYHLHYFSKSSLQKLVEGTSMQIEEVRQVTCAEWWYYQFRHIIDFPKQGEASPFFAPHSPIKHQSAYRGHDRLIRLAQTFNRWGLNQWITRFLDLIGLGDNWIVVVVRTK